MPTVMHSVEITQPKAMSVIWKWLQVTSGQDCVGAGERKWHNEGDERSSLQGDR